MEMVEEGNIITPKRCKVEEISNEEVDRISDLPDALLLEILPRLPSTEHAIRTGTLSKRWKYLWTWVSTLIFKHSEGHPLSDFVSFVDETLTQCRQMKLRKFAVHTTYDIHFESQFYNWIRYAASQNAEEVDLIFDNKGFAPAFVLNEEFFFNSCFTHLKLQGCVFMPTGVISWKNLRSLLIFQGELDEGTIEKMLSGSPLLENLTLSYCYGYSRLDITSKSVKKLVFDGYDDPHNSACDLDVIEINAPNILSLKIDGCMMLWKLVLVNVSSLVEVELDYMKRGHAETSRKQWKSEMLKGFIQSLCHVKELKIGDYCSKALSRLEAKGFVIPSNVKFSGYVYSFSDSDDEYDTGSF